MEPNKLETQIKEQLKTREIQPSSMTWDRLDAKLTAAEENTSKRFFFFSNEHIVIAASILLLVSLGTFYFSIKENLIKPENNVVIGNINRKSNVNSSKLVSLKKEEQVVARYNMPQTHFKVSQKVAVQIETTVNSVVIQNKEIEYQSNEFNTHNQFPKEVEPTQEILVSNKIKVNALDLLATVDKLTNSNTNSKIKINANSLLSQVDGELDQTFREKVLKRISKNYKEIKVALQARNQK